LVLILLLIIFLDILFWISFVIIFFNYLTKGFMKLLEFIYLKTFFKLLSILVIDSGIKEHLAILLVMLLKYNLLQDDFVLDKIYQYNNLEDNDYHNKKELEIRN